MISVRPRPGEWVLLRAKVTEEESTVPENVLIELFSKTDQYSVPIRWDLVEDVVDAPVPPEPVDGTIVAIKGIAYQRLTDHWYRAGRPEAYRWVELARLGEMTQWS